MMTSTETLLAAVVEHQESVSDALSVSSSAGWSFPLLAAVVVGVVVGLIAVGRAVRS